MPTWTPDPSFYPSPRMAAKAPPETIAYVAAFDPERKSPDAHCGRRRRSEIVDVLAKLSAMSRCRIPATNCTISAGTPARPACARTRRIRTSSAAISSCRDCAPRASTSSTPSPIRGTQDRQGHRAGGDRREDRLHPPAHRPLRARGHLRRGARKRRRQGPRRRLPDGPRDVRAARPVGGRPRAAAARLRRLVASRLRHDGHQRVGHARHVRERSRSGNPARQQIRPAPAFLGLHQAQARAGDRFRRGASARLRAQAGARPDQGLWLRQLRGQPQGPVLFDLDLVSATATSGR